MPASAANCSHDRPIDENAGDSRRGRPRPPLLRALGTDEPPAVIDVDNVRWRREQTFKHDSWAATAVYANAAGERIVCKFNRVQPIFGIPMRWLGRRLARREAALLRQLHDEPLIPSGCGIVRCGDRQLKHAVAHDFVPGRPLRYSDRPAPGFFEDLERLLTGLHRRGIAYVDLHKRENVLLGDDGRPHLIDFQISLAPRKNRRGGPLLRLLQASDRYHLAKHGAKLNGRRLPRSARPWWIRWHRTAAVPLRTLRRRFLVAVGVRTGRGAAQSEAAPEIGLL